MRNVKKKDIFHMVIGPVSMGLKSLSSGRIWFQGAMEINSRSIFLEIDSKNKIKISFNDIRNIKVYKDGTLSLTYISTSEDRRIIIAGPNNIIKKIGLILINSINKIREHSSETNINSVISFLNLSDGIRVYKENDENVTLPDVESYIKKNLH